MKKLFYLFFAITLTSASSLAQNGVVTNAILYHRENDLASAKKEIDKAVVNEKTLADPKAWYYKGHIYSDISRSDNPAFKTMGVDFLNEAVIALNKAKELDPKKGEYYKLADTKLNELWSDIVNQGINEFNDEKAASAIKWFEIAQGIKPQDTTAFIYGSYAAEAIQNKEALSRYTNALLAMNYKSPYVYKNFITLQSDPQKKIEVAQKAVADYPKDQMIVEYLGDIYTESGKHQEALNTYKSLNNLVPTNATILLKVALQYERLKDQEHALEYYQRALLIKNDLFLANYNSAIIYYEKAKAKNDELHKLSVSDYQNNGKKIEEEVNALFGKSLSHANAAKTQTADAEDIKNIDLIIAEINKVYKK